MFWNDNKRVKTGEEAHIPSITTLLENAVYILYNEWQFQALVTHYVLRNYKGSRNSVEQFQNLKGLIPRKYWTNISCGYAQLLGMSFITTNFHEIQLSGFRGVPLTRKTGLTDWLTDGRIKNILILYLPKLVGWWYN